MKPLSYASLVVFSSTLLTLVSSLVCSPITPFFIRLILILGLVLVIFIFPVDRYLAYQYTLILDWHVHLRFVGSEMSLSIFKVLIILLQTSIVENTLK